MTAEKIRSADDLLFQEEAKKLGKISPEKISSELETKAQETKYEESLEDTAQEDQEQEKEAQEDPNTLQQKEDESSDVAPNEDEEVDDYGTPVDKKKMFTQEEVQEIIRERLSRGRNNEQQQQAQEAAKDFKADPESEESWEAQLGDFVEKKIF